MRVTKTRAVILGAVLICSGIYVRGLMSERRMPMCHFDDVIMMEWLSTGGVTGMHDATLWTLTKGSRWARAESRPMPGVGVELRFVGDDDTRSTQIFQDVVVLAAAASAKRDELIASGWRDAPPHRGL